ncbi:hypothetical protein MRX96_003810 [Rhipicephalus microplus]
MSGRPEKRKDSSWLSIESEGAVIRDARPRGAKGRRRPPPFAMGAIYGEPRPSSLGDQRVSLACAKDAPFFDCGPSEPELVFLSRLLAGPSSEKPRG